MAPVVLVGILLAATTGFDVGVGRSPVARVNTRDKVVALTFDACATTGQANGFDRAVFDILKREHVPATVFLGGRWIETHRQEAQELAAVDTIEIGNHTWSHPQLSLLSEAAIAREIDRAEDAIKQLGRTSVALRPPFGDWNARVARVAETRGLPLVVWDVVSGDAGGHLSAPLVIDVVTHEVTPGSIVIFHINGRGPRTKDALPAILANLRARGYRFVKVSELLALEDGRVVAAHPFTYVSHRHPRVLSPTDAHH